LRILIAEDNALARLDLRVTLERAGHEISGEARDGLEAVALARSDAPDLAILDVRLPFMDGIEAARAILAERPIPIVILTGYHDAAVIARAREAGIQGTYLLKPFHEPELLKAIEDAAQRAST
jgi:two-component system, response regulator PdtaR